MSTEKIAIVGFFFLKFNCYIGLEASFENRLTSFYKLSMHLKP